MCSSDLLGIQILYHQFNLRNDVYCERVYSPWPDLHKIMKEQQIPLFALETQDPIKDFDFLCMTLQYELCYPNILQILDLGGIPLKSADRTDHMPIVIGGGPCAYNPEPIADFFDIFYIGEGETVYDDLFDLYEQMKEDGSYSRQNFLHEAIADGYEADIQHAVPTTECAKSILNIRRVGFHYGGQHTGHARLSRIRHIL